MCVCLVSAACTLAGIWFLFGWLLRLELYPGLLFGGSDGHVDDPSAFQGRRRPIARSPTALVN